MKISLDMSNTTQYIRRMYTIIRRVEEDGTRYEKSFTCYHKSEAISHNLEYVYWKDCTAPGWVLTDDDMVIWCYKYTKFRATRKAQWQGKLLTAVGPAFVGPKMKFDTRNRPKRQWVKKLTEYPRGRAALSLYCSWLIEGRKTIDWDQLGRMVFPTEKIPAATFRKYLRQPEAKIAVRQELEERFTKKGITVESVLDDFATLKALSIQEKDLDNLRETVFKMAEMLDMIPGKKSTSFSLQHHISSPTPQLPPDLDEMDQRLKEPVPVVTYITEEISEGDKPQ